MRDDIKVAVAAVALLLLIVWSAYAARGDAAATQAGPEASAPSTPQVSAQAQACLACHQQTDATLVHNWEDSKHLVFGVDCLSCHAASNKGDRPDIQEHYGVKIITQVSVSDCQDCHTREIPGNGR